MNASAFVIFKITPGSNECQPCGLCLSTTFFKAACKLLNISGMGFPQGRRQRGANGAWPPISNMCPPIHFWPPVLYNPTLCSKDDPPLHFLDPCCEIMVTGLFPDLVHVKETAVFVTHMQWTACQKPCSAKNVVGNASNNT